MASKVLKLCQVLRQAPSYSLGLKDDGSVAAWGDNYFGQCDVPAPNTNFIAIAAGAWYSLGLKEDGSVATWGANTEGQCNVPAPNSGFVAISAGGYHSLGLKEDGSIAAWGDNNYGQCDVGAPNSGFVGIAGGGYYSLGLKVDGSVAAWGANDEGQCNVPAPNSGFTAIAAGFDHSLGLKATGNLTVDLTVDQTWMYQSIMEQANSKLAATASITEDPLENTGYTYEWQFILPDDVSVAPAIIADGGSGDPNCTFAAPGCDEPGGLSNSGQPLTVRVTVTGTDFGNRGIAEAQFGIALLGDVNNDTVVNVIDRSIVNSFWRLGAAGPFELTDCDINCDGEVNVIDRSIANAVWRGLLGRDEVSEPCTLR